MSKNKFRLRQLHTFRLILNSVNLEKTRIVDIQNSAVKTTTIGSMSLKSGCRN